MSKSNKNLKSSRHRRTHKLNRLIHNNYLMCPMRDQKKDEYEALIEQRHQIIVNIKNTAKSFHQVFMAIVTFFSAVITILLGSDIIVVDGISIFILFQALFLFLLFLLGLLSQMNNNRDYIRAIDKYIEETYNVRTLFYQGELGFKHISGIKSSFSLITLMGGIVAIILAIVLVSMNLKAIISFFHNILFLVIIVLELGVIISIIFKNFVLYKISGKSKYYDDCLSYLKHD